MIASRWLLAALDPLEVEPLRLGHRPRMPSDMRSAYPPMALSGVRSSCDIVARNSVFALFACSTARRAAPARSTSDATTAMPDDSLLGVAQRLIHER